MKNSDLDKYIVFPHLCRSKGKNYSVVNPFGLVYTKVEKKNEENKYIEIRLLMVDDDVDIEIEKIKDKYSPYHTLVIKYKWKDYKEAHDEEEEMGED